MIWSAADLSNAVVDCVDAGPIGITALAIAEKLCPLIPSYVVFIVIGIVLAAHQSDLSLAMLAAATGSTAGSLCWYGAGRSLGETRSQTFAVRFGPTVGVNPARYHRIVAAFRRNLLVITAIGQTIPAIRVYIALPAGALGVCLRRFVLGTFVGSLAWSAPLVALGYFVGDGNADPAFAGCLVVAALIGLEFAAVGIWRFVRARRS
ncbi:DedA family protein [soil metagenome]